MRLIIQRVDSASLSVDGKLISSIEKGFCVYVGAKVGDTEKDAEYLAKKLCNLRIFRDENDKMNLSLKDVNGEILLVSNFTLYADCTRGHRPNFCNALNSQDAKRLYDYLTDLIKQNNIPVKNGVFGAHMKIDVKNNGPVNIVIDSETK